MKDDNLGEFAVKVAVTILIIIGIIILYNKKDNKPPVKESVVIDSLTKTNDSIKLKVESLDSIKNAKIIEVSTLDNDSTIKLFYELVSK